METLKYKGLPQSPGLVYHGNMSSRFGRLKPAVRALFFFFPVYAVFAGGSQQTLQAEPQASMSVLAQANAPGGSRQPVSRGEAVFNAFAAAYPDRVKKVEFFDGDWTIEVYGERFFFAEGRLLPASLRRQMNEYNPHPFYNYVRELPPWRPLTEEESARMREHMANRSQHPVKRSPHFYDTLWRSRNKDESWEHIKQIRFLGQSVQVHYSILTQLSLVEAQILRIAKTNTTVRQWINNLNSAESWNWRNIAASQSRSFHAYGAAIDLLPRSLRGLETYWLWTANHTPEWWNVPYTRRFHPPDEIVKAFESFGFIWGGKWRYYDTMHFEYRPEILILSGIPLMDLRDLR